jgi:hypothetical protein
MALSNRDRVGKALELLNKGLQPFIERELKAALGSSWETTVHNALRNIPAGKGQKTQAINWDTQALLAIMEDQWQPVFTRTLGKNERTLMFELRDVRNKWAHQEAFTLDDAYRAMDSVQRLLTAVSAGDEASEVEKHKQEVLRLRFEEQTKREARKASVAPIEGQPSGGLKPWREIVTPHPDVASGRYIQAEFAADLWQVFHDEGSSEYRDPKEFFRRTYLTEGLKTLLGNAIRRLSGTGSNPVIELQTNFGGGKTHSLIASWHMFSGAPAGDLAGADEVLKQAEATKLPKANRAVFVGTRVSPGMVHKKDDGTVVRTLWGEIAWQLGESSKKGGGKGAYEIVRAADESGTNPGDALAKLFKQSSPCLILIDEWVAYARQLYNKQDLPAGSFDTQFTFAQALCEAATAAPATLLVVSIPVSDIEIGGEGGHDALTKLRNVVNRHGAPWRPAGQDESFEIVRRRLFEPIRDPALFTARDAVARAFVDMYRAQSQEFPSGCREAEYERRIQAAYPIHPELFDRLYEDWAALERFQRTRGVLKLMAAVIHELWERQDSNLLIMPATVPIDAAPVRDNLTEYLEENWSPVIEKDIDGPYSLPLRLDRENPNLGRYSAARRVARALFLGSAATSKAAHRGLEDTRIKLGCVQPGESVATFGDGLRRLTDSATHLYQDGRRYWYSTQPSVTTLARDRAGQQDEHAVLEEIKKRLRAEARTPSDFGKVHPCLSGGDVPDEPEARLVILAPEFPHTAKSDDSPARKEVAAVLENRGSSPRNYRNALVFLAPDRARLADLDQAVRQFLAWKSIQADHETLNLDAFSRRLAETKRQQTDETADQRIPETYCWVLLPVQQDSKDPVEWREIRVQGDGGLAVRMSRKLRGEALLVVGFGGTLLRQDLDKIPLWRGDHVAIKQLAEDYGKYTYLSRLRDSKVLVGAIRDGLGLVTWAQETFAYAEGWDETRKRYRGLRGGEVVSVSPDGGGLLVRPEVAVAQLEAEAPKPGTADERRGIAPPIVPPVMGDSVRPGPPEAPPAVLRRFHGSVRLDPARIGRDAGRITEEVVQHLSTLLGAEVQVTLEVRIEVPDGVPESTVRVVNENCRTLRFESHGFESA